MPTIRLRTFAVIASLSMLAVACTRSGTPMAPSAPSQPTETPAPMPPAPTPEPAPAQARYRVTFESTWSASSHPTDFPDTAHYSGLIGGTHTAGATFWQAGAAASEGIQLMAERGRKTPLDMEVMNAIAAGTAEFVLSGPALDVSPGTTSMEFDVSQSFPLVTLVTMVAPSPDWFTGVSGLLLFVNGQWLDEHTVELFPYDAGTDSGVSYESANEVTDPRGIVARLEGYPVAAGDAVAPFGTFTFSRME